MTTNILLAIGIFWGLTITTTAVFVAAVAVCKYIDKRDINEGLDFLANAATVTTALAVAAILWVSACSFLSDRFQEQNTSAKNAASSEYTAKGVESANAESALILDVSVRGLR